MNRAEATVALLAGKKVERVCGSNETVPLRWHGVAGMQCSWGGGHWEVEAGTTSDTYREAFEPRIFLGVFEEVKTFAEAQKATGSNAKVQCAFQWWPQGDSVGTCSENSAPDIDGCWLKLRTK